LKAAAALARREPRHVGFAPGQQLIKPPVLPPNVVPVYVQLCILGSGASEIVAFARSDIFCGLFKFFQYGIAHVSQMLHFGYFLDGSIWQKGTAFIKWTAVQQ
jgi:hypothetical protein